MEVTQEYTIKLTNKEVSLLEGILREYQDYKSDNLNNDFDSELYNFAIKLYDKI